MKLKRLSKIIFYGLSIFCAFGAINLLASPVNAAEEKDKQYVAAAVSPTTTRLGELEPGHTYSDKITVKNEGTKSGKFTFLTSGYYVEGENYNPIFPETGDRVKIADWITFEKDSVVLSAGESYELNYKVKVPKDAPAGGQYANIIVHIEEDGGGTITASGDVRRIIYSWVSGETHRCGEIISSNISGFLVKPPITANAIVENCGNVDVDAEYILRVFPLFSDEEIYTNEDVPETNIVLPNTRRMTSVAWSSAPSFGIFRVEETVRFHDKETTISKFVVIFPIWLIVLILLFIGVTIFSVVATSKQRKAAKESKKKE